MRAMAAVCVFCRSEGRMSREHVFAHWLTTLGLAVDEVEHWGGPLNRMPESKGRFVPFTITVRAVCEPCNNGWMSSLDGDIVPTLRPILLGHGGTIDPTAAARLTKWALKTTLVAMHVASRQQRADGYGLPVEEYATLYRSKGVPEPPPGTQMWIGRYVGEERLASAWATPQAVTVDGVAEHDRPQGYTFNVVVGEVLLCGFRFTTAHLDLDLDAGDGLVPIWPPAATVEWPPASAVGDAEYQRIALGQNLSTTIPQTSICPWSPAVDLPQSQLNGGRIEMPTTCGRHTIFYPLLLAEEAVRRGREHVFATACECGTAYLIRTKVDGAHVEVSGNPEAVMKEYDEEPGVEIVVVDECGSFFCKKSPRA